MSVIPERFLLEIYLTNRCNLNCSYCSAGYMIRREGRKVLSFEQIKRAVDIYASCGKDKNLPETRKIFFTGGEPLLEFELLKEIVGYIRGKKEKFQVLVTTNGVLLDGEKVDFLLDNDVRIFISLDGCKNAHDLHRVFRDKTKSSFDAILNNIRKIPFQKRCGANFCISSTLSSKTIKFLPETMEFFRQSGFGVIELCLEAYEIWTPDKLEELKNVLEKVRGGVLIKGFKNFGKSERMPQFIFSNSSVPNNNRWELSDYYDTICHNISFMYDGYFYPCEAIFGMSLDSKYRVGDIRHGVDFKKVKKIYSKAISQIRKYGNSVGPLLTAGRYYYAINHGMNLNDYFENACEVNKVFDRCLWGYWKIQRLYDTLTTNPPFGDFGHSPKYKSDKEIKGFRLTIRNDSDIAGLRKGIDYFLYSPGSAKKLVLDVLDGTQAAFDVMEGMVLYSLMKAGNLKKRITLTVACRAGEAFAIDAARRRYLNEHGVRTGVCFAGGSKS